MPFSSDVIALETNDHIATCWLDRPDRLNAMGPAFWDDLPGAMQALGDDDDVRAIILAGRGRVFSSGLDLQDMGPAIFGGDGQGRTSAVQEQHALYRLIQHMQRAITSVAEVPKPVIAAVHGACIGGAIDLITACDIRLAASNATFSVRETKMAMVADLGTLQRITQIVPQGHVAELVYTGKDIDAARAARIGLVNDVYADFDALMDAAREMAREIAANSPLAVQGAKAVLRAGQNQSVQEGLDYVALWNAAFLKSNDLMEAMQAFMQKRTPEFTGE